MIRARDVESLEVQEAPVVLDRASRHSRVSRESKFKVEPVASEEAVGDLFDVEVERNAVVARQLQRRQVRDLPAHTVIRECQRWCPQRKDVGSAPPEWRCGR